MIYVNGCCGGGGVYLKTETAQVNRVPSKKEGFLLQTSFCAFFSLFVEKINIRFKRTIVSSLEYTSGGIQGGGRNLQLQDIWSYIEFM